MNSRISVATKWPSSGRKSRAGKKFAGVDWGYQADSESEQRPPPVPPLPTELARPNSPLPSSPSALLAVPPPASIISYKAPTDHIPHRHVRWQSFALPAPPSPPSPPSSPPTIAKLDTSSQPASSHGRPSPVISYSVFDSSFLQFLAPQYASTLKNRNAANDDPFDLEGIIREDHLAGIVRCGGGGFGDVYRLRHNTLGDIALKRVREVGNQNFVTAERRRARREAKIWHALRHPNVLQCIGVLETKLHFFFVSAYAGNGTISAYLHANPDVDCLPLLAGAAHGLAYLHKNKVIHGDVKAANVLISDDRRALVCDFGMTRAFDCATSTSRKGAGSVRWMSPEVLMDLSERTPASDTWGFGMMLAEVITGDIPFADIRSDPQVIQAIVDGKRRPGQAPMCSPHGVSYRRAWHAASLCWREDPTKRPTMEWVVLQLIPAAKPKTLCGNLWPLTSVVFSPASDLLAWASWDNTISLWDVLGAKQLGRPLEGHRGAVFDLAFSPDGQILASGSDDHTLRLWDIKRMQLKAAPLEGHTGPIWSVAYSPDGDIIATGAGDRTIRLWNPHTETCIAVLNGHVDEINCVAFSSDGKTLASASDDRSIRLWDVLTKSLRGPPLLGHTGLVVSVAFSHDNTILVSGSEDNTIRVWDVYTARQRGNALTEHSGCIQALAFSADGGYLISGSQDGTIRIWRLDSLSPETVVILSGQASWVRSIGVSRDGKWLASGSNDEKVQLWDLDALISTI